MSKERRKNPQKRDKRIRCRQGHEIKIVGNFIPCYNILGIMFFVILRHTDLYYCG